MSVAWERAKLVVFDVDGTLYSQQKLRPMMAALLAGHCLAHMDFSTLRILGAYRRWREELADQGAEAFEEKLILRLAKSFRRSETDIRDVITEWIDHKPLRLLRRCRYPGVTELFTELKASGRTIGVLSDYPARSKLRALELEADFVVSAQDAGVGILKPDPRGLHFLINLAGASAEDTIMIGDRVERDGEMGRRAGVTTYLRSARPISGWDCFTSFHEILPSAGRPPAAPQTIIV